MHSKHMEEKWGVNALFGVAVAAHESSWGNSHLARTRNNLFGIAAYDGNEGAAIVSHLWRHALTIGVR